MAHKLSVSRLSPRRMASVGVVLTMAAAAALSACSDAGTQDAADKKVTIGVVVNNLSDSNQADILRGYQDAATKYGWTVKSTDSQGDPAKANAAISTFVQQQVTGIAVLVYEGSVLTSGITAAKAAGIPVILNGANTLVPGVAAAIPVAAGKAQGEAVVAGLGGSGSVLMFTYPPGAPCIAEFEGTKAVFDANPGIKHTEHDVPAPGWVVEGQKATAAWLQTHPAGSENLAIWGCWDGPTFGAIAALTAAKRTDVKVYGNGGEPEALTNVRAGKMTQTIFYDQYTGGGLAGADLLKSAIEAGASWEPKVVPNPSEKVDSSNIEALCAKYADKCK